MTLQSPTATLIPLFSSSELTGCGYPGLLDRKNRSDMYPQWESNPRRPACKASTLSTRPGSPLRQTRQLFNSLYTGGLFHCYMLDRSFCHSRGVLGLICHFKSVFDGNSCYHSLKTLIRCHIMWHLTWVCTCCL